MNVTVLDSKLALAFFAERKPQPAVRHGLSVQENKDLRELLNDAYKAVEDHVHSFVLEDVTPLALNKSSEIIFNEALLNHPHSLTMVDNGRASLVGIASRDSQDWMENFRWALQSACSLDPHLQRKEIEEIKYMERSGTGYPVTSTDFRSFSDDVQIKFAGMVLKPVSQEDVDAAARSLSARFGFDGVVMQDERVSCRQKLRWIERTSNDLQRSCAQLGIEEMDFGRRGGITLEIITPLTGTKTNVGGTFCGRGWPGSRISINAGAADVASVASHEFSHALDHDLGLKAMAAAKANGTCKGWTPHPNENVFFSRCPPHIQEALPAAKKGLEKVFSALSSESLKTQCQAWIAKSTSVQIFNNGEAEARVVEQGASQEIQLRMETLADRFLIKTVGEKALMGMPKENLDALRKDLRADGDHILIGLAAMLPHLGPGMCVFSVCSPDFGEGRQPLSFMSKLKEIHGEGYLLKTTQAVGECTKQFSAVAAMLHPASKNSIPSKMIEESIEVDLIRMKEGIDRPYLSQEIEIFARAIGRPKKFFSLMDHFSSPGFMHPLSSEKIKKLNDGFLDMTQAAGCQIKPGGPDLSVGFERTLHAVSKINNVTARLNAGIVNMLKFTPDAKCKNAVQP